MAQETAKITLEMTIDEIFSTFPQKAQKLADVLTRAGLSCVGCQAATWETLEVGMRGHGMQEPQIEDLLNQLNAVLEQEVDLSTITLTPRAAQKFLSIAESEGKKGFGIRFAEVPAGCSGFEYELDFSEKADAENDLIYTSEGIEIHIAKAQLSRLLGSEIDYTEGLRGTGFKISNPNVRTSCGCGSSHNY